MSACENGEWKRGTYQVCHEHHDPSNVAADRRQVQEPSKHSRRSARDAQVCKTPQRGCGENGDVWYTVAALGEYLRGLAGQCKAEERAATCVEEAVCGTPGRGYDDRVDNMI